MYTIIEKENFNIYVFDKIDMSMKIVDNGTAKKVYIDYKGYNPAFSMLIGGFEAECEMDSIEFDVDKENGNNTMYFIINSNDLDAFVNEIYFFIMENKVENKLNEQDLVIWDFESESTFEQFN